MQINIVLKVKCILVIYNIMISMATHNATFKNEGVPTKIHISKQQLILEY